MPEKKKAKTSRDTPLGRFILRITGADKVIKGLENEPEKKKKDRTPKDTRGMRGMRIKAGQSAKVE